MKLKKLLGIGAVLIFILLTISSAFAETKYLPEVPQKVSKNGNRYGQWNACNFGEKKMKKKVVVNGKEVSVIYQMAQTVKNLDILVIQEVSTSDFGAKAVAMFADELNRTGSKWEYIVSDRTSGDGSERYAVLWKTSAVSFIVRPNSGLDIALSSVLDREPYHAQLKMKSKNLNVYSFHLVPTAKNPENEARLVEAHASVFDKDYAILSGDFNLGHKVLDKHFEGIMSLKHQIEGKTSLKTKEKNSEYLHQEYDNIYTGKKIKVNNTAIIDFVKNIGDLEEARKLSDHLIAYIEFEML